jgi:DNA-binding CsgD family transcriptional regulator
MVAASNGSATPAAARAQGDTADAELSKGVLTALADAIAAVERPELPARLTALIELATAYESAVFVGYFRDGAPRTLSSNLSTDDARRTLDPYLDGAYLLDPWYNMVLAGVADGVYRLAEQAPDDFAETEYFKAYYSTVGLQDEFAVFARLSPEVTLVISVGTREHRTPAPRGLDVLARLLPCLAALCVRQWGDLSPDGRRPGPSLQDLGPAAGLSEREMAVTQLLLRGYSNKGIARDLEISPETVKVYRKRINKKLGTSSSREVFARFFPASPVSAD